MPSEPARLEARGVVVQFPAVRALDGVSLGFRSGEVHAVVGENGAGKSTLMRVLGGLQTPTEGTVAFAGTPARLTGVLDAQRRGVAMIHQELNLVDDLTVAENVHLGREPRRLCALDRPAMRSATARALNDVGANFGPDARVGGLSLASKQLVEVAKALVGEADVILMDEPTAVLSDPESQALFALIGRLRARGATVVYISHRLPEVCRIADRVTVLRDGAFVQTLPGPEATPEELARLMVGRPLSDVYPTKSPQPATAPVLEVTGAEVTGHVAHADLAVRPGEIVGVAGLVGAGRTELCEAIVGARRLSAGHVRSDGAPARFKSPAAARDRGVAYVSEDRKGLGLILSLDTIENTTLAHLRAFCRPLRDPRAQRAATERWKRDLDLRVADLTAPVHTLSGGNQQKVALAKWLETRPRVLILDEPTRGVDVGAKREIYRLIHRLASEGMACVVVSSELPEVIGLCHRVVVMREGRTVGELAREDLSEEAIMRLAAGVGAA